VRACADAGDRWQVGPPVRRCRRGLTGPRWAELSFSFSRDFLNVFLFIFSRVFNSNSIQFSNSNQFKHVHQFQRIF
jgi:hypothetical protein